MEISYLGHSSFKIKTKTATVITDPFDPDMVGLKFSPNEAEIVTVSHAHKDHNAVEKVSGIKKIVEGPGEYEINGVSIILSLTSRLVNIKRSFGLAYMILEIGLIQSNLIFI